MKLKTIFILTAGLFIAISINAQNNSIDLNHKTDIIKGTYDVLSILKRLDNMEGINVSYSDNEIPAGKIIDIKLNYPTIKEILEIIQLSTPCEYKIKDEYIIIKKKALLKKYKIYGKIEDETSGESMTGVNIFTKEKMKGGVTNENGSYEFYLPPGEYTIVISYMGYISKKIPVYLYNDQELNVSLTPGKTEIDEVRITVQLRFFGNMDKGRTIESIDAKEIEKLNANNASDILHARLGGVWTTKVSGAPGDHQRIRIRGINSLFGSVDPLYVIDGVPVPNVNLSSLGIADLNIHDIENITVLKDASSTALYGYQGGNGVVIIDTKRGRENQISFATKVGIQNFSGRYDLMNTKDFLASLNLSRANFRSHLALYYPEYTDSICSTDWQEEIFQNGLLNEYQLTASGTVKKNNYYISGNYYNHDGIVPNSSYSRFSLATNLSRTLGKGIDVDIAWKAGLQQNKNNIDNYGGNNIIFEGINKSPCFECTPDSLYFSPVDKPYKRIYWDYPQLNKKESPRILIDQHERSLDIKSQSLNTFFQIPLVNDLFLKASSALSFKKYLYESDIISDYFSSTENVVILCQNLNLTYIKKFNFHNITMVAGFRNYKDNIYWRIDSLLNEIGQLSDKENIYVRNSMAIYGERGSVIRSIRSYMGHINYNYKEKYFISLALNQEYLKEGMNVDANQLFPSVALNWNLAKEWGLNGIRWLNNLNVYANWGLAGNYPLNGLSDDLYAAAGYTYVDTIIYGSAVHQLANHFIKQEKVEEYNFGVDISLFDERVLLNVDYYVKTNSDLIMQREIPYVYGSGRIFYNVGTLENKGTEFMIELFPVETPDFKWYSRFIYSLNNEKIKKLTTEGELKFMNADILSPDFRIEENERLGNIYGFKYLGRWTDEDEVANNIQYIEKGGLKYLNHDTADLNLYSSDKVLIGNSIPDYTWNWYNSIQYKNFTVSFLWYAVVGVDKFNATRAATYIAATNHELNSFIADTIKGITSSDVFYESSYFIDDASFIRLKNLTFSYFPEKKFFDYVSVKLSLSFENLLTITGFKGYDPETSVYTDNHFSDNAVDRGAYPNPKAVYVSIKLNF